MSITNFIPTIWSENLVKSLNKKYTGVANCSREYEGEIKNIGSVVKICGVGTVRVEDYCKNDDMSNPQTLNDTVTELKINQAKCFNFQIDDIDRAQCTPKLMDAAMAVAAEALAEEADRFIYSFCHAAQLSNSIKFTTPEKLIDFIIDCRGMLNNSGAVDSGHLVLEVSPRIATLLLKAKVNMLSDNSTALENGCIGNIAGCKVFVSNNIDISEEDEIQTHHCLLRTTRALAFAEQLSEIEAYRPEKRFADAVKGLHLYGAAIVYPKEFASINVIFDIE